MLQFEPLTVASFGSPPTTPPLAVRMETLTPSAGTPLPAKPPVRAGSLTVPLRFSSQPDGSTGSGSTASSALAVKPSARLGGVSSTYTTEVAALTDWLPALSVAREPKVKRPSADGEKVGHHAPSPVASWQLGAACQVEGVQLPAQLPRSTPATPEVRSLAVTSSSTGVFGR